MMKILLIDDEPDILRVLTRSLKADGYAVASASSGADGLAVFETDRTEIVITDIKMPGMDGIEVLKHIKTQAPDTEVIIITGHGDIDNAIEALQYGASDFINKPVRDEALSIALKRAEEKIDLNRRLKEYTHGLEDRIEEATRELRRRTNFQGKLIRSSIDGIVATDDHLRIVIFNPGAERIFGYLQEEVINTRSLSDLLPENLAHAFQRAMSMERSFKEFPRREIQILSQAGERIPVTFSGSILMEGLQKLGTVAFFQDLREIKHLQRELVHSERLAAIGQTIAGLAHGIKNILHGFKGGSYLVDVGIGKKDSEKIGKGWDMVKRNIDRTANLVMDLLSYSKEREPEFQTCSPNEIADRGLRAAARAGRPGSDRDCPWISTRPSGRCGWTPTPSTPPCSTWCPMPSMRACSTKAPTNSGRCGCAPRSSRETCPVRGRRQRDRDERGGQEQDLCLVFQHQGASGDRPGASGHPQADRRAWRENRGALPAGGGDHLHHAPALSLGELKRVTF